MMIFNMKRLNCRYYLNYIIIVSLKSDTIESAINKKIGVPGGARDG